MQGIYRIAQLHCPHCAVEIEKALRELDFIEDASLSFATRQLHLTVHKTENLLEQVQTAASRIDPEIRILERDTPGHHHAKDQVTEYARKCEKFTCS
ncbi:MAG: heavy metal translocating P-type ATPase, partial [Oscillospiraceae bacterium]|nr:heavy metal translocating P-type ATPase [Oscillospiraceae bacterium]